MALRVSGPHLVDEANIPVRLREVGLGGWLNMENFITGYPANESAMRAAAREVLGERCMITKGVGAGQRPFRRIHA